MKIRKVVVAVSFVAGTLIFAADQESPMGSLALKPMQVNKETGEVFSPEVSSEALASLNTESLKAARKAAIYSTQHPEEFAKTLNKDEARLAFEKKELEAITTKSGFSLEGVDPIRAAKIRELLEQAAHFQVSK